MTQVRSDSNPQPITFSVPDAAHGKPVHAVVVRQPGATSTADELTSSSREHVPTYERPRTTGIADTLAVSGAGKIRKRELRARHGSGGRPIG